ncbi:hypothetical protein H6P81_004888 [Aristolochia fimbriata]|uniref:Uncharacterized protein n=1 Tax=Aristolochia fimbriata TaxID=158543 RepID=A0AAV7ETX4_ARIFI|nr:hypothetical protein H6P81_004888 [Aristolochia fimbriata]
MKLCLASQFILISLITNVKLFLLVRSMATGSELKELGSDENSSHTLSENDQHLTRVVGGASGEGLPYAPENWPNVGDMWKWKVGWRKSKSGFWLDRYLYLPDCLQEGRKRSFKSKFAVKSYLEKEFPNVDVNTFFASFSWKIPCANNPALAEVIDAREAVPLSEDPDPDLEIVGHEIVSVSEYSDHSFDAMGCKAGNRLCDDHLQTRDSTLEAMECNICCNDVGYCRDCCCMLCFKTLDWVHGGYSFFRCEARVNEMYICNHAAHISCALRCYMAGTVGGSIGLDAEYYCRHCYNKSDLIGHVTRSLQTCKSLESRDEVMKILNIGFYILRGSRRMASETLRNQIELILTQLKSGVDLKDIWRTKGQIPTDSAVVG